MANDKIFGQDTPSWKLGTSDLSGYTGDEVDITFKQEYLAESYEHRCCVCTSPAVVAQLVPLAHTMLPAPTGTDGLICNHCLSQHYFDPKDYRMRSLNRGDKNPK